MKYKLLLILIFYSFTAGLAETKYVEIRNIKVYGNATVSEFEIFNSITVKEQKYEINNFYNLINDSIKSLFQTGYFKNISMDIDKSDTSVLLINIQEKPIIKDVAITGIHNIKKNKDDTETISSIRAFMTLRRNQRLDLKELKKIKNDIIKYYRDEGYYFCHVEDYIEIDSQNRADITLRIIEGGEVKVKYLDIYFEDMQSGFKKYISRKKVNFKMKIGKNKVFKMQKFTEDIQKLQYKYLDKGHVKTRIDYNIIPYKKENKVGIKLCIFKGPTFNFGGFEIKGNSIISSEKISEQVTLKKDKLFRYSEFKQTVNNIKTIYLEEGYIEADIKPERELKDGKVYLTFNINEGEKSYIEDIIIKGNIKTRDKVILRELLLKKGDIFNGKKLDLSRRNLVMLNFFDDVKVNVLPGSEYNKKIIEFEVEEGRTGTLSFGAGYSSVDKLVGFLEASKNNFDLSDRWSFTGKGQKVNIKIEFGKSRNNFELGWADPWFNDDLDDTTKPSPKNPLYFGYKIYNLKRRPDYYDILRTGGDISLGRRLGVYNKIYLNYKYERVKIDNVDFNLAPSDIIEEVNNQSGLVNIDINSSVTLELNRNVTDSAKYPTKGYILNLTNQFSGGPFGGNVDFYKPTLNFSYFIPSFKTKLGQHVIALNYKVRTVSNIFTSRDVPSYEKFFLGGSDSIRGYSDRSIKFYDKNGGNFGGMSEQFFNLEYRIPLVKDTLEFILFYDGGNLKKRPAEINFDNLKFGYGFGLRIMTPMGKIRLDFGRRVNETYSGARDQGQTEIHFNIGPMF